MCHELSVMDIVPNTNSRIQIRCVPPSPEEFKRQKKGRMTRTPTSREIGVYWHLFSNHCTRECIHKKVTTYRTSPRNRNPANPANRTHLDQSLRSSRKNRNSLTWVLVALTVCFVRCFTYPVLYRVLAESRAGEWEF